MSERLGPDDDPFAGYTPVPVRMPDAEVSEPPKPRRRNRGSRKHIRIGGLGLCPLAAVAAILVFILAAFVHGAVYSRPIDEIALPDVVANQVRRLGEWGKEVRRWALALRSSATRGASAVEAVTPPSGRSRGRGDLALAATNVVLHRQRMDKVEKMFDVELDPSNEEQASESASSPKTAVRRLNDRSIKQFDNGGRQVRPIR